MVMQVSERKIYTATEYLELELQATERHEYRNGEIIAMTGGMPNHNQIAGNLYATLNFALRGSNQRVFFADQRLWIPQRNSYTYPDVMVVAKPLEFQPGRQDTVINPSFIAEVLSKSTQDYDRSEKFAAYRSIAGFREYLLIDQYTIHVEHYVKIAPQQWTFSEYDNPSVTLSFDTLNIQLSLAELYINVDLSL
jgi:Uma2 family endonuclease